MSSLSGDIASHAVIVEGTGAQTDTALIPLVAGKRIRITALHFFSTLATTFIIEDDSTEVYKGINVLSIASGAGELRKMVGAIGEALTYTTTAGNSLVYIEWNYIK